MGFDGSVQSTKVPRPLQRNPISLAKIVCCSLYQIPRGISYLKSQEKEKKERFDVKKRGREETDKPFPMVWVTSFQWDLGHFIAEKEAQR